MFFSQPIHANESFLTPKTMVKIHFPLGKKIASRFPLYAPTAGTQLRDYTCPFQQLHLHAVLEVGCLCWPLPHGLLYAAAAVSLWTRWRRQPFLECELLP